MKSVIGLPKVFLVGELACELGSLFQGMSCELVVFSSVSEASVRLEHENCAVLLVALTSGLELLATGTSFAPIVLLTSEPLAEALAVEAYAAGAADIIQLPLHPEIMRARLKRFLDSYREREVADTLDQIFHESPALMSLVRGPDHIYEKANQRFYEVTGLDASIMGRPVREVFPEIADQGFLALLKQVYETGETVSGHETSVILHGADGSPTQHYMDFVYQPLKNARGQIYAIVGQSYDVTEKVQARRSIDNERDNFLNLYRQTPEMVCILRGPDHVFEMVNDAHIKVLGFDATGLAVREAQPESIEVHGILDSVYRTGKTAELHEIPVTVGGRLRFFNLTYAARRDENDRIDGIMVLGTEITEQIRARRIQEVSQARFRQLADSMPQIVYVSRPDGTVTFLNKRWYDFTGSPYGDGDNRISSVYMHPEDWPRALAAWEKAQETRQAYAAEIRIRSKSGDYRWFITRAEPNFEDGTIIEWFGTSTDIHDQKLAAEELIRSRERYRMVFEGSPLPMIIFDRKTQQILDANNVTLNQYGYARAEFLALGIPDIQVDEARHRRKDGSLIHVEPKSHDMTLDGREVSLAAIVDVTKRVEGEWHLQAAKEEAERANQLKSAFLANMSHEIRTPLGAMIGFADLLRDTHIGSDEHANYIGVLTRNGEQLSIIINDILDLSKVEAGHLTLEYIETDPRALAREAIELLVRKAQEKNLELSYEPDATTPATLVTDPVRLRQVLLNLLSNAIKFTHRGFIRLRSSGFTLESGQTMLTFEVEDSGIGVPADQHEPIFEMFVQADGSVTRRFGGTGLGLALSRKLARALGGDVQVKSSRPQEGSTFLFTAGDFPERVEQASALPASQEKNLPGFKPGDKPLVGVKVLVIDDSADNRRLVSQLLRRSGADVDTAEDGFEGYRRALTGDHHLVLMDVQMPLMDGYTATQKLREHGYRRPIIALTAHAMTEVRKKCLNVGCNDHLPKPINPQDLIGLVARYTLQL